MSRAVRLALVVLALLAVGQMARPAAAQGNPPYAPGCGGWGYGPPFNYYQREHIPYYALHPPVYYSYPVARPYGYSPFAYPPGTMTPEVVDAEPMSIINPHVPAPATRPTSLDKVTRGPEMIINPYVERERLSARPQ